jgi:hypothetical protein
MCKLNMYFYIEINIFNVQSAELAKFVQYLKISTIIATYIYLIFQ